MEHGTPRQLPKSDMSSTSPSVSAAITKGEGEESGKEAPAAYKAGNATPQIAQAKTSTTCISALIKARESVPQWIAFTDYFEKQNGFFPTAGDGRVEELFNYYLVGAWDVLDGRHKESPSVEKGSESI